VADLAALDELCAWMRSNGATSARVGDVALTLGPPIVQPVEAVDISPPESEEEAELRDLETLLYSSGGDARAFLTSRQKATQ
jgi:hypothetical protein